MRAQGHTNIKATHKRTFELVPESDLTESGTCIVGVSTLCDREALLRLRGQVRIELACGGCHDVVHARINPFYIASDPLIIRTNPQAQHRSLCIDADKGSASLDRRLVAALRSPDAQLDITISEIDGDRSGALFLVGMPIGNALDLSPRAIATLASVDLILAEDPRTASSILGDVRGRMVSFHLQNEAERTEEVLAALDEGCRVALISRAGMPVNSDTGFSLLRAAIDRDIAIGVVPGPGSASAALAVAGFPTTDVRIAGFLPAKSSARGRTLQKLGFAEHTTVVFEAAHRLREALGDIARLLGQRRIALCRNLTGPGEVVLRGPADEVLDQVASWPTISGEFTIVIAPVESVEKADLGDELVRMATSLVAGGVPTKAIANALSAATGAKSRDMFRAVLALKHAMDDSHGIGRE
ncbi:16S rRNA (cytidine(1402)-2'-O)-methyltransferase [Parerythrobacter lacustris]|nr:16S rRNA (cytidine(1402)-2'-O)-methyltransferase [Parerythrobacter lacustris]